MAKEKISELEAAAALDGTELVPVVQGGETVKTTTQDIADLGGGGAGYLVYTALLTQTGTDAPVATVLENTLGGAVVWSYDDVGFYIATLVGAFTENKTWFSCSTQYNDNDFYCVCRRNDADEVFLSVFVPGSDGKSDVWSNLSIEIRVYP